MSLSERLVEKYSTKRPSMMLNEKEREQKVEDDVYINSFLKNRDIPVWFRGLSNFQLDAANRLLNALRDDSEQGTADRVRECVQVIGLRPVATEKEIKKLIFFARGNDLAFLWFLMELHYKPKNQPNCIENYTLNEQLIMSCIAHLDMITTLRGLDAILPPPQLTKAEKRKQRLLRRKARQEKYRLKRMPSTTKVSTRQFAPYFEKLRRPKLYGKSLIAPEPEFRIKLNMYGNYENDNYTVPNEYNRWFAQYELQPGLRVTRRVLNEQIENIFEDYARATEKAEKSQTLCEHHKVMKEMEKNLEAELKVIAKQRCLQYVDVKTWQKNRLAKRMAELIEQDVETYMTKFKDMAKKARRRFIVHTLTKDSKLVRTVEEFDSSECVTPSDSIGGNDFFFKSKKVTCENPEPKFRKIRDKAIEEGDFLRVFHEDDSEANSVDLGICDDVALKPPERCICGTIFEYFRKGEDDYNKTLSDYSTPTQSQTFFHRQECNQPFQFDYRKIFNFKENTPENINIRKVFVDYLDSEIALQTKQQDKDLPINLDAAAANCARKMWEEGVFIKSAEMELDKRFAKPIFDGKKVVEPEVKPPFTYDRKYFDPDDADLMTLMLKDHLAYMAKNRKFVLASMPGAYKLPILQEWIKYRYGKVYTRKERFKSFALSLQIFRLLDQTRLEIEIPKSTDLGQKAFITYKCRDYLLKKAKHIKTQYYEKLDNAIMDGARIFWFAMQPYLCSNGPPRNTFFAYTPARVTDIMHFRIWKLGEFMNAKAAWEQRRAKERIKKAQGISR